MPPNGRRGFALIIALMLMGFLLLLVLSLSSWISVESRTAALDADQQRARENALFALNVALSQLQKYAGPDQRITGTAALLDTVPQTTDVDGIKEPHWTGVWDSDGNLLTWLVSGNEDVFVTDSKFVTPVSNLATAREMYEDGSVKVPLQNIDGGAYAYWIADEGVKAKITLADTGATTDALLAAQMVDITRMSNLGWLADVAEQDVQRLRMLDVGTLKILATDSTTRDGIDALRHSLTANSYGLLTNPVDGGLKRDLTLALYDDSDAPSGQIFGPVGGTQSVEDPGGPQWQQLRNWVRAEAAGELAVRAQTDEQTGVYPVVTLLQYYVVPRYDADADRTIYLEIQPVVTLWNPYDRVLEATNYRVDIGCAHVEVSYSGSDWLREFDAVFSYWGLVINGTASVPLYPNNSNGADAPLSFTISNCRLEPGEAKIFSPQGNALLDVFTKYTYAKAGQNELHEGYRPGASFYVPTDHQLGAASTGASGDTFKLLPYEAFSKGARLMKLNTSGNPELLMNVLFLGGTSSSTASRDIQPNHDPATGTIIAVDSAWEGAAGAKAVRNFTERSGDEGVKWVSQLNPRARNQGSVPFYNYGKATTADVAPTRVTNPSFYSILDIDSNDKDANLGLGSSAAGVGFNNNPYDVNKAILFEVAAGRNRLFGIGQLMQAPLFFTNTSSSASLRDQTMATIRRGAFDNLIPAYAIGNSAADPYIALDATYVDWKSDNLSADLQRYANITGRHYDYSYLLNKVLWDGYFFSALTSVNSRESANPRLVVHNKGQGTARSSKSVGAEFLVDGAFNVNSVSEEAWRALLGAFFGQAQVDMLKASPFVRIAGSPGAVLNPASNNAGDDDAYHGYRALTQDQIVNLAHQIVKQVKWRRQGRDAPFTSMADFVNRDPYHDAPAGLDADAFRLRGVLSAAIREADLISSAEAQALGIDANKAKINAFLQQNDTRTDTGGALSYFTTEAMEGWRSEGIPGWLTQADLLARLGHVLAVRSDTFKIRVCGEARDPVTDLPLSVVWGEAIVQRLPEFMDAVADSADTGIGNLSSTDNQLFGRRFVVISFRWLNGND